MSDFPRKPLVEIMRGLKAKHYTVKFKRDGSRVFIFHTRTRAFALPGSAVDDSGVVDEALDNHQDLVDERKVLEDIGLPKYHYVDNAEIVELFQRFRKDTEKVIPKLSWEAFKAGAEAMAMHYDRRCKECQARTIWSLGGDID